MSANDSGTNTAAAVETTGAHNITVTTPPAVPAPAVVDPNAPTERAEMPNAEPCTLVIFGAVGDLSRRKLIPALYDLFCHGCLPPETRVLGVGQYPMSDAEFRVAVREGAAKSKDVEKFTDEAWNEFAARLQYLSGDLQQLDVYRQIAARLPGGTQHDAGKPNDSNSAPVNRLFYFSTPPSLAPAIVKNLGAAGLAAESAGWSRIIVEKPFGRDLESARALNAEIATVFTEPQVYRIDHYLGKETVQNILVFRFGNSLFEPIWNRNYIEYVEITAAEPLGVGGRAGYYEEAGALRDMVANHLLQLLALTAMEPPVAFDADSVREEKVQVFRSIRPMTSEQVADLTVRGQYGTGSVDGQSVPGYREEQGVAPNSNTETFVAIEFHIDNWRWSGVPFYVRTGKRLSSQSTEVAVHLKRTPQALFARTPNDHIDPNVIVMRIQPDEGIKVAFAAKRPGPEMHTGTVHMDFSYESGFNMHTAAAYETLLLDTMQGDATLFTRRDEVEAEWKLITPIEEAWATMPPPAFPNYAAGSEGPAPAEQLLARRRHCWRPLSGEVPAPPCFD